MYAGTIPENMLEIGQAERSSFVEKPRSREVSGQQTSKMFSGTFMSHQGAMEDVAEMTPCGSDSNDTRYRRGS